MSRFSKIFALFVTSITLVSLLEARDAHCDKRVKYIQADAPAGGNGSKHHPFNNLADAEANEENWDVLIVRSSTLPLKPIATFNLLDGRKLVGEENPTDTHLSLTQPTIVPQFSGNVITVNGEVAIENIFITAASTAINYDNATNLSVKNVLITNSTRGLSGTGRQSGKTDLTWVTIRNSGTAVIDALSQVGVMRKLILSNCSVFNSRSITATTLASARIELHYCNFQNSTISLSNQGEQEFLVEKSSIINTTINTNNSVNGLQSINFKASSILSSIIQVTNLGNKSIHAKDSSFDLTNINIANQTNAQSSIDLIECTFKNSSLRKENQGKQSFYAKKSCFANTRLNVSTQPNATSGEELIDCKFASTIITLANESEQIFLIHDSSFISSTMSAENKGSAANQKISLQGLCFVQSSIKLDNMVAGSSSTITFVENKLINSSLSLLNFGKQTINIKKSTFINGQGIELDNKGQSKMTVDQSTFENLQSVIEIFEANSSTEFILKNSRISFGGTAVRSTIFDQAGTSSTEKFIILNNSITADTIFNAINDSIANPSGTTDVVLKENSFNGNTVTHITARNSRWIRLNIDVTDNCFKSINGVAFTSSGIDAGNVLIRAHKNSFVNFILDIDNSSTVGIKWDVSKNWWGHDPAVSCALNEECEQYQTCIKDLCQGPLVSTPFAGTFITAINPLTHPLKCPDNSCH